MGNWSLSTAHKYTEDDIEKSNFNPLTLESYKNNAIIIKQERERILNEIREKANEYCMNTSCNMECADCEHGAFVRTIVEIIKN